MSRGGKIPAGTLSGGLLSDFGGHKVVKEYRVWYHPEEGDDGYKTSSTFKGIRRIWKALKKEEPYVEPPLAVIWDKVKGKYREVVIDELKPVEESYHSRLSGGMEKGLGAQVSVGYASKGSVDSFIDKLRRG